MQINSENNETSSPDNLSGKSSRLANKKILLFAGGGIAFVILLVMVFVTKRSESLERQWIPVTKGDFTIDFVESGVVQAVNTVFVRAPPGRIDLQIVNIVSEGVMIEKGDFLLQFDTAALQEELDKVLDNLGQAKADMASVETQQANRMSENESNLLVAEYSKESVKCYVSFDREVAFDRSVFDSINEEYICEEIQYIIGNIQTDLFRDTQLFEDKRISLICFN